MIIEISKSLIKNRKNESDFNLFLENILLAYKEGKHVLLLSQRDTSILFNDENTPNSIKEILKKYSANSQGINRKSLEKYINNIVSIIPNNENEEFLEYENPKIRKLQIKGFLDSSNIQKTIFLGENDDDIEAYCLMAEFYMKEKKIYNNYFKLQYDNRLGGGSTTIKVFKKIYINRESFCLAILDKDKKSPNYSIKDTTARSFENSVKKLRKVESNYKCDYIILKYLEIENYFPKKFYEKKNSNIYEEWLYLENSYRRKYFDFKEGIQKKYPKKGKQLNSKDTSYNEDWTSITNNENFKINGFGSKILSEFIKLDYEKISKMVKNDKEIEEEWLKLGKTITSFLLGTEKRLF